MSVGERDPHTGQLTTGHEWNGITELNNRVPRPVYFFLAIAFVLAAIGWVLLPAWPTGRSYTKGLLGSDQHNAVADALAAGARDREAWIKRIQTEPFESILADQSLMNDVRQTARTIFADNCAACHGADAKGRKGFPNLTGDSRLWGDDPAAIAQTIRVGVNSANAESRTSQMPAFGQDGILKKAEIANVVSYVRSLSDPAISTGQLAGNVSAGHEVFVANCAACHGEDAKGNKDIGSRNLTDKSWLYGGDAATLYTTIFYGRQGHMPTWAARLSPEQIKMLTLYLVDLRSKAP